MLITRTSPLTGLTTTLDLPITQDQLERRAAGALIQHAFPHLEPWQREFIMTGYTQADWAVLFPPEDEGA
ncbi:MAG TPA: hypothetical protein PKV98_07790 [Burkholderiaceae bacterium]|nr:hypothetical protein [Burkholderiaceae bacterium]